MTTRIIGIDPGYGRLGIAVLEKPAKGKETVLYSNCFQTSPKDTIYERFGEISTEMARVLDVYKPDGLAVETLFITKNQKTAMRVAEAKGVILSEAIKRNIPIFEYTPMQIKVAVTSDGNSGKDRILKMVRMLVPLPDKKLIDDEYDAIAVALTHSAYLR
ncbi:MAG: crossover junction endodeoxyribonuclease RuvC [Candidatus Taylorbacteria bacterium RIFCSPHIGHO2_02_FULL_45_28]|uniref:Crossover junction endodeoxyribonuclease RuvC n=1 Tax=Candidatus Taylorbacteria bacterium RIFCSPHIGHO2_12_FULL_45_16 TaxID=1802315 RepID=A0A1G2N0W2_9BACT|nr:MAG: crossover junction endodeoxyribonuclease RuvC [Candidatus Taylorbacteria bacterium RIFCSPHIGHO2_01_FULL_44_110]OHA24906.1 MAG: crossover junction endodeoxyribonuclease RuvC [Candidatus Taylorbacteria bacterium RIFCSPHIGHO2_02_FULL_45_28]OHA29724.1 MAG: crossover junction endodeoxyribonuclease RuvC [Candidatus Taylorbacteria bacterium RIFCSPHIGHO2_12_FULL_45_16]OHA32668.1 MAG: crossover junction endodeoxyribonuclease RuvC [Candidatus Taylorbacteria bacterium RIFCSPLOWO2_01_FULL_45_59]OHA